MRLAHLIRLAAALPPRLVLTKGLAFAGRLAGQPLRAVLNGGRCSYPALDPVAGGLRPRLGALEPGAIPADRERLRQAAAAARAHRFDLLGSGPVRIAHGERYGGFGGHRYGPGAALPIHWRPVLAAGHRRGNRRRAAALLAMIDDPAYRPIDWHVDFISGYRWSPATWGGGVPYAHRPGVDVKLPWELARMQHLPPMALLAEPEWAVEFRHQVLDFLGSNPPGWGVNWACAMDVAIRAVNMALAWDLFRAGGARFDPVFERELAAALLAHGRHVMAHLEWSGHHRGNHYLADICGMAFIAAYLPATAETGRWLAFATGQLNAEIERQFTPDGANFEASTAYHRLSAEMALYAAALLLGLDAQAVSPAALARLAGAVRFAAHVTKPSGEMVQIGDNDSGRFVRLAPDEGALAMTGLLDAAQGLFQADPPRSPAAAIIRALAGGHRPPPPAAPPPPPPKRASPVAEGMRLRIEPPDPSALDGLEAIAYPDFGLYLWRNERSFVSVRCGPIGQNGQGGHAHNDQLAVEIEIDGVAWVRDPGSFVYTPDLAARDRYRSVLAHFAPRRGEAEPARLLAPFRLEDRAQAEVLCFGPDFVGCHRGFGIVVHRRVAIVAGAIVIEDWPGSGHHVVRSPAELARLWRLELPFSPGYGLVETGGPATISRR